MWVYFVRCIGIHSSCPQSNMDLKGLLRNKKLPLSISILIYNINVVAFVGQAGSHCIVSVGLILSYLISATNTPEPADVRIMLANNSTTNGSANKSNLHSGEDETVFDAYSPATTLESRSRSGTMDSNSTIMTLSNIDVGFPWPEPESNRGLGPQSE